jgi:hypothetical protein
MRRIIPALPTRLQHDLGIVIRFHHAEKIAEARIRLFRVTYSADHQLALHFDASRLLRG